MMAAASEAPPATQSALARYEIGGRIGRGEYADVYSARRRSDGTQVAIKRIKISDISDEETRRRLETETTLMKRLNHPNIIKLLDSFWESNDLFVVVELAEAGDLASLIEEYRARSERIHEGQILRIVLLVARGLAHMHRERVIHRDIKPANIYVTRERSVKIGDLGLGRVLGELSKQVQTLVGTPFYMSPEQVDERGYRFESDIWALGCVTYELAMLQPPFVPRNNRASLVDLGNLIREGRYPPVSEHYSQPLRDLIARMLDVDPQRRPAAQHLVIVLEHLLAARGALSVAGQPTAAPGPAMAPPASPSPSPPPPPAVAAAAAAPADMADEDDGAVRNGGRGAGGHLDDGDDDDEDEDAAGDSETPFSGRPPEFGESLEEYQKVRLIGRGRFSEVFLARHRGTGEMVAVKKVIVSDPDASKHLFDEARLLRKLPRHPNIVHCRSIACYRNDLFMVLEVAERGDLDRLIREKRDAGLPFREEEIWRIFKQIAMALQHMHRYKVLHRDLKPSNVFLMESGDVKLGDLGLGREIGSYSKQVFSVVGTQRYMPPELVLGTGYTVASEIWGLGCVLYEMATLQPAFPTTNLAQLSAAIREARFDTQALAAGNSQALISLVTGMLQLNPAARPTIDRVVEAASRALEEVEARAARAGRGVRLAPLRQLPAQGSVARAAPAPLAVPAFPVARAAGPPPAPPRR